ncbi:hypothetical protein Dimus_003645 [Dionaea muscipula]
MSVIHLKKKDIVKSKVRGVEMEFDHEKLATILGIPGNNGICEYVKDKERQKRKKKGIRGDFDWEAMIDEAAVEGESGSGEKFYDAEDKDQGSPEVQEEILATAHKVRLGGRNRSPGVDTSCPTGRIPEAELLKF